MISYIFDNIILSLRKDGKVKIVNFGTFYVTRSAERIGLKPTTGEKINIPETKKVKFKTSKKLKEAVY